MTMASSLVEYLFVFALLVRITASKLAECGSDQKVFYGIVAVDVGCHEGCAKLEIECPGYKCACFFKKDGRCMLNVRKTHHYRIRGCETVTDSSNRGSKISKLSNAVASEPKKSEKETGQITEVAPQKESKKEDEPTPSVGVEPTASVEQPSAGVEPQPSGIGPGEEPEAKPSEVPVEHELFQNPELELDADADCKNKKTVKTKVASKKTVKTKAASKKTKKEVAEEEARVLHELFSLEDNFGTKLALDKDVTKDIDIVSQEIAYESSNDDVMVVDMIRERRKRLGSRKGSRKRSFVDVKDKALNGAEANEALKLIT